MKTLFFTCLAALVCTAARAGDPSAAMITNSAPSGAPSDLTLGNFFSEGWNQDWTKRSNPDDAPDMALLRVQTNFLEREWRTDYYFENDVNNASKKDIQFLDSLIAYGLNRRIMLEAVLSYEWIAPRGSAKELNGLSEAFVTRFQLVDTEHSSYALTLRAQAPTDNIGMRQTTLSYALAGWNDLTPLGLPRVGLYYHIQEETYLGPGETGAKSNDITYDISLAKTWTASDAAVRNFTTFVEAYATTNLDGDESGQTAIGITPGIRFTLGHGHVFMAGVDIPLSTPKAYTGGLYRFTYIYNF